MDELRLDDNLSLCSCCLRSPYRVLPHGLYTESVVLTSKTTKPPPEWRTGDWDRSRSSSMGIAVSAAKIPMWLSVCVNPNKMRVDTMVRRNFVKTQ